ncbi:MAG: hypothetical protein AB8H12_05890 [Lewinella sp.]
MNNALTSPNLKNAFFATMASVITIQPLLHSIEATPNINIPQLPNLSGLQHSIIQSAHSFHLGIMKVVTQKIADIDAYSEEYAALSATFISLAQQYSSDSGQQEAGQNIARGLSVLIKFINSLNQNDQALGEEMSMFVKNINQAVTAFAPEMAKVESIIGLAKTSVIKARTTDVLNKIQEDNSIIARGAIDDVVPILKIVGTVLKAVAEDEVTPDAVETVVSSVETMVEVTEKSQQAMDDIDGQISIYRQLLSELKLDELRYAATVNLYAHSLLLGTEAVTLAKKLTEIHQAFNNLINDMDSLRQNLLSGGTVTGLPQYFQEAAQTWNALRKNAHRFSDVGSLPVTPRQ